MPDSRRPPSEWAYDASIVDYKQRWLLDALADVTDDVLADPRRFGPMTRATYRAIGVDLDTPDWREQASERRRLVDG